MGVVGYTCRDDDIAVPANYMGVLRRRLEVQRGKGGANEGDRRKTQRRSAGEETGRRLRMNNPGRKRVKNNKKLKLNEVEYQQYLEVEYKPGIRWM